MSNIVLVVVVLPTLAIVGVIIALNVIPPLMTTLITTLQELAKAYPVPTSIALLFGVPSLIFWGLKKS